MVVYPAAGLIDYIRSKTPIYVIDPGQPEMNTSNVTFINKKATSGTQELYDLLTE